MPTLRLSCTLPNSMKGFNGYSLENPDRQFNIFSFLRDLLTLKISRNNMEVSGKNALLKFQKLALIYD